MIPVCCLAHGLISMKRDYKLRLSSRNIVLNRRRTRRGSGGGGAVDPPPPQFGQIYDIYSGKRQHICLTNCVTPNGTSIHLPEIHFGWVTKETFIGYSLRPSIIDTSIVHYYCFLPVGAAWQTSCVRHSDKTRFDPPNGCWPVRLNDVKKFQFAHNLLAL